MAEGRVRTFDISTVWLGTHPNDGHPGPDWHRMVAHFMAESPAVSQELGLPELLRPGSVSLKKIDFKRFHLELPRVDRERGRSKAKLHLREGGCRVDGLICSKDQSWYVGVARSRHRLTKGKKYSLEFQGRADAPRTMDVCITSESDPLRDVELYQTIELGTSWSDHQIEFEAKEDAIDEVISFRLSRSLVPVEIRNIHLIDDSGNEVLPEPLLFDAVHSSRE
jgi:hypothetical protein